MYRALWFLALSVLLLLSGCGGDNKDVAAELNLDRNGFTAYFDLTAGVLPFPTNILFTGSTDATLNIPVVSATDFSDPKVAMNALDGFSTIAPISTSFSGAINSATLTSSSVRVFEVTVTGASRAVTGIIRELVFGVEFVPAISSVDATGSTLVILPTAPLKSSTNYMVMLSDGIKGASGLDPQISAHYMIAKTPNDLTGTPAAALEGVRALVNLQEAALAGAGVDTSTVILSWTFTTQSVGIVLGAAKTAATGTSAINPTSIYTTADLLLAGPGLADVYFGSLTVPYYLTNATTPTDPLTKFWTGAGASNLTFANSTPSVTSSETIPLLVTIPNTSSGNSKPAGGWKTVIFQHGITSNRTAMLAAADSLAAAGFAVVAIDLPLHGLAPTADLYSGIERTFDLDLVSNTTGAAGPDGTADSSGTHYINLSSLLTTRDNGRQAVADLFALKIALDSMDYGSAGTDFDTANIYFVGHSLGAMVGVGFVALETSVNSAVLGMPGGGVAKLLDGSATFGPRIAAGLAANGVIKGTADFESFMGAFQTVIDTADPLNHAAAVGTGRGVLLFEVLGDGVVPNNVMADAPAGTVPSPLAGTDPLVRAMGLELYDGGATPPATDQVQLRFISGDHSSILDPTGDALVTSVMQTAMATFLATDGATVTVSDPSVLE